MLPDDLLDGSAKLPGSYRGHTNGTNSVCSNDQIKGSSGRAVLKLQVDRLLSLNNLRQPLRQLDETLWQLGQQSLL